MTTEQRARAAAARDAETDPVQREAYALARQAGYDWYDTESSARRAFEHCAAIIVSYRLALSNARTGRGKTTTRFDYSPVAPIVVDVTIDHDALAANFARMFLSYARAGKARARITSNYGAIVARRVQT